MIVTKKKNRKRSVHTCFLLVCSFVISHVLKCYNSLFSSIQPFVLLCKGGLFLATTAAEVTETDLLNCILFQHHFDLYGWNKSRKIFVNLNTSKANSHTHFNVLFLKFIRSFSLQINRYNFLLWTENKRYIVLFKVLSKSEDCNFSKGKCLFTSVYHMLLVSLFISKAHTVSTTEDLDGFMMRVQRLKNSGKTFILNYYWSILLCFIPLEV